MILSLEQLLQEEAQRLADYAVKSADTRGRLHKQKEGQHRLPFQRDRDRIIHCQSFRRLKHKTQVFIAHAGDHYRDRLTHTLEVTQISRDIARTLQLNEDLAESIALAHDLGHTPFGHGGEEALDEVMQTYGKSFEHNRQSRRIVEKLEKRYPNFDGLNLSIEVLEGLVKHRDPEKHAEMEPSSLEAQAVNLSDEIAYHNHDLEDGLAAGILKEAEVGEQLLWKDAAELVREKYPDARDKSVVRYRIISSLISLMITDIFNEFQRKIDTGGPLEGEHVISFSEVFKKKVDALRSFLYEKLYYHPQVVGPVEEGKHIIQTLFKTYSSDPALLPNKLQALMEHESPEEVIKDYIAGMTDNFAVTEYQKQAQ